jgi:4-aminobutyrate aminotransferase-like enzyme
MKYKLDLVDQGHPIRHLNIETSVLSQTSSQFIKPFGNGMCLGAVIATHEIAHAFDVMGVEYFNTFGGNPESVAAGLAVLDVFDDESLQQHVSSVGDYLKEHFQRLQTERL